MNPIINFPPNTRHEGPSGEVFPSEVRKDAQCPSCEATGLVLFYRVPHVPAHSVLIFSTVSEARNFPKGNIELGFCPHCGFINNVAFDSNLHQYSSRYEATQGFSPTFNAFHKRLAKQLIEKYNLHNKEIIEIGCGNGEFLTLLCELGENKGIGFDPAYLEDRVTSVANDRIHIVKDFYSGKYSHYQADFLCCKMTLEHIQYPLDLIKSIRANSGDRPDTIVLFQVPDVTRILDECAFWDIYYEHCSYFSRRSLGQLFEFCGFQVLNLSTDYDGQYLLIEARPIDPSGSANLPSSEEISNLTRKVADFATNCPRRIDEWRECLRKMRQDRRRVVIWGAGSKAVAFLTTLGIEDEVEFAVDINPHKNNTYLPGTGHKVMTPDYLNEKPPDVVIVMNPIYRDDVRIDLDKMGLSPELLTP
jgi:hypothetical protein